MPYVGRPRDRTSYDTFGRVWTSTTPSTESRFAFTGRDLDPESDLYHYRARYYDPATGQFISPDPIGFEAGDGNLYRYVGNGPIDGADPSGLEGHLANVWNNIVGPFLTGAGETYVYAVALPFTGALGAGYYSYSFCREVADDPVGSASHLVVDYADTTTKPFVAPYREGLRWYLGTMYESGTPAGDFAAELSGRDGRDVVLASGMIVPLAVNVPKIQRPIHDAPFTPEPGSLAAAAPKSVSTAINPRLAARLQAFRSYRVNGGTMDMARWVKATQRNSNYGTGFKSSFADWSQRVGRPVHGNSLAAQGPHDVYVLREAGTGRLLHFGETGRGYLTRFAEYQRDYARLGIDIEVDLLRTVEGKAAARAWETRYIDTFRRIFGQRPPDNPVNH